MRQIGRRLSGLDVPPQLPGIAAIRAVAVPPKDRQPEQRPGHGSSVRDLVRAPRPLTTVTSPDVQGCATFEVEGDGYGPDSELAASSAAQRSSSSRVNARRTQNSLPSGSAMTTKVWSER
jgi:hypothetical protein